VRVHDNGLYLEVARRLARDFGRVEYYNPWEKQFPTSNQTDIGSGVPEFEKILDFYSGLDNVDLFVFPDIYFGGLQVHLEELGKRVWGGRLGDELEIDRKKAKEHFKKLGISVGPYEVVVGMEDLRAYLKEHDNVHVKISRSRGDTETFQSENYTIVECKLDELEHSLGAKKSKMEFLVESNISGVELSYDGYSIDGKFPSKALLGVEVKGKSYIGVFKDYNKMPKEVIDVNSRLSDTLRRFRYRNFISPESRETPKRVLYLNDPCCRVPSPPGELYQAMFENFSEIIWNGAEGKLVDPISKFKVGVELRIYSPFATKNQENIQFPSELRENLKFRNLTVVDGKYYVLPQDEKDSALCGLIAMGATLEEAISRIKEYVKRIKAFQLDIFPESLDEAKLEIEKLESFGVEFF
jgi:hypothetical protein